jgi:hypothetical protein
MRVYPHILRIECEGVIDSVLDIEFNIKYRTMPSIQVISCYGEKVSFQKRKTCRSEVEYPAHKGFVEEGLMRGPPSVLFNTAILDGLENARIVGRD